MATTMTWDDFTSARKQISERLGLPKTMSLAAFEQLLGVKPNASPSWKQRSHIPGYMTASIEAHGLLSKTALKKLYDQRVENT